jgi:hypothetical protein
MMRAGWSSKNNQLDWRSYVSNIKYSMVKALHTLVGATDTIVFAAGTTVSGVDTTVFITNTTVPITNTWQLRREKPF